MRRDFLLASAVTLALGLAPSGVLAQGTQEGLQPPAERQEQPVRPPLTDGITEQQPTLPPDADDVTPSETAEAAEEQRQPVKPPLTDGLAEQQTTLPPAGDGVTPSEAAEAAEEQRQPTRAPAAYMAEPEPGQSMASAYIGRIVVNQDGERVGEVNDLVMDADGRPIAAVIGVGGFLGLGEKNVAVPLGELQAAGDGTLTVTASAEELQDAPNFAMGSTQ